LCRLQGARICSDLPRHECGSSTAENPQKLAPVSVFTYPRAETGIIFGIVSLPDYDSEPATHSASSGAPVASGDFLVDHRYQLDAECAEDRSKAFQTEAANVRKPKILDACRSARPATSSMVARDTSS
jgi:hypothetical protein